MYMTIALPQSVKIALFLYDSRSNPEKQPERITMNRDSGENW